MVFAPAKPRPEAELDGVGICEVAAVVPHPVLPSTGPPDHSPKLFSFSVGNPVSVLWSGLAVFHGGAHVFLHGSRRYVCRGCTSHLKLVKRELRTK